MPLLHPPEVPRRGANQYRHHPKHGDPQDACPGAATAGNAAPPEEWVAGAIESLSRLDENKRQKVLERIAALGN